MIYTYTARDVDGTPTWRVWTTPTKDNGDGGTYTGPKNGGSPLSEVTLVATLPDEHIVGGYVKTGSGGSATFGGGTSASGEGGDTYCRYGYGTNRFGRNYYGIGATDNLATLSETWGFTEPVKRTTTNATPDVAWSYAVSTNRHVVVTVDATVLSSTAADSGTIQRKASFRRAAGSAAQIGATTTGPSDQENSWGISIALSTNTIQVTLTGKAATTAYWRLSIQVQEES